MKKKDLKEWIILLAFVPTMLTGVSLATYFTVHRISELDQILQEQGTHFVETLAIAAGTPQLYNNQPQLKRLIYSSHRKNAKKIVNIAVFNRQHQLMIFTGDQKDLPHISLKDNSQLPTSTYSTNHHNHRVFFSPIYSGVDAPVITTNGHQQPIGYIALHVNQDQAMLGQQSALLISILVIIVGWLISLYFSYQLGRRIIRPVRTMVKAINAIGAGKGDVYIEEEFITELDLLKNGINSVAKSLNAIHLEMQMNVEQATSDLRETMEQIEIQNVELNLAKRKALDANRVKSEFLANMSHELRTPLNGIIGFARQLLKTNINDNQRDHLETIANSANCLLTIINDILDFSKLDAGRMVFEKIPFALRDTINEVMELLSPGANAKQLEFSLRLPPDIPDDLIADPLRIKQVLVNLIGNAIKFTDQGSVTVELLLTHRRYDQVALKCVVADTGIGIEPQQQQSLFTAFGQADSSITRRFGGTGLGLIISQKMAQQMDGRITLESELNRGSRFTFSFNCKVHNTPLSPPLPVQSLANQTLLYFEPQAHTRLAISELLASWALKVTQLDNIDALPPILRAKKRFDRLIIGQSASATLVDDVKQLLKQLKPLSSRVYLLVNDIAPDTREALLHCGLIGCIDKPVDHRKLATALLQTEPHNRVGLIQAQQPPLPATKQSLRILAVDDNEANLKLITTLLLELVEQVEVSRNGAEALALCSIKPFDLIFMDIQMPVMDGITACQQIQTTSCNQNTPIIAVTAHALSGEKERLIEVGFNDYLTKPIDEHMLQRSISQIILPQSDCIDWTLARQRAGGKTELAIDMLKMLLDSLPISKAAIVKANDEHNHQEILKQVHKLQGACCYTGVPKLKNLAEIIETGIKQHQNADGVEPEIYELIDVIDHLLADCADWLE